MEKLKFYAMLLLMAFLGTATMVSCGSDDDEEDSTDIKQPQGPNGSQGGGTNSGGGTSNCYTEPSNILLMSDGIAFNWKYGSDTKYYYWGFFTQYEYNLMSEGEIITSIVTGKTEDRNAPDNDDFACLYNCDPSSQYVIVTVSYASGDKQGDMVVTPLSTKSTSNQPRAAIENVHYNTDYNNNAIYKWSAKKNNYCKQYYTYAAASPDMFYSYMFMDEGYTPMVAWLIRNEILKNGEDHSTNINVWPSYGWDFDNGRDKFFGAQVESGTSSLRAFKGIDKYLLLLTWGTGSTDELSGVFESVLYTLSTSSSTRSMSELNIMPRQKMTGEPGKLSARQSDFRLIRLE